MKLVIFGLSMSSSWGNGHATLWRGVVRGLLAEGHRVVFFERDVPYYAGHRDLTPGDARWRGLDLVLFHDWARVRPRAERELADADAALVTSFCADGVAATELVLGSPARVRAFYDLDTPITFARLRAGEELPYIHPNGLGGFDVVLSYTGGRALDDLRRELGARRALPLYGSVDPAVHRPAPPDPRFRADLSYLGTHAADREQALTDLLLEPARRSPQRRFLIGGAQYPKGFPADDNVRLIPHVPPADHPAFYGSAPLTLNVTRRAMAENGHCPSGRLFEAAACGAVILSDRWPGLEDFFEPGAELIVCERSEDVLEALERPQAELRAIASAARARVLSEHTGAHRARELVRILEEEAAGDAEAAA